MPVRSFFKTALLEPENLLHFLQTITDRAGQKIRGESYESGFKVPLLNEDFAPRHIEFEEKSSFTPLASCEKELYHNWLGEMLQGLKE